MRCRIRPMTARGNPGQPSHTPGVAVVGYGYWGLNLVGNFVDLDIARAVSVSDLDPEKLTLVRRRHAGVEVASEFRELLTDPRVHAAAIATPVNTHYQLALAALKERPPSPGMSPGAGVIGVSARYSQAQKARSSGHKGEEL
jgi:hypothetical protein